MDAAYLTPGATATVIATVYTANPVATTSDPSVVSISGLTRIDDRIVTFTVTALKPGTSIVNVDAQSNPLLVTVVAAGTSPRWPGGVAMTTDSTAKHFDEPFLVTLVPSGVAPLSGATATGTVVITGFAGQELARKTITGTPLTFPLYPPSIGSNRLQLTYSGDANFIPQTLESSLYVYRGRVTITGTLAHVPDTTGTYSLTLHLAGSPLAAPTGVVSVMNGTTELARVPLLRSADETASGHVTLTNLTDLATLTLNYEGDALYESGSQQVRVFGRRRHTVRHP
jgi:hypothetical protein